MVHDSENTKQSVQNGGFDQQRDNSNVRTSTDRMKKKIVPSLSTKLKYLIHTEWTPRLASRTCLLVDFIDADSSRAT